VAVQALENIEIRQIFPRFTGLHSDAADQAMAYDGTQARIQVWYPCEAGMFNLFANSAARDLIQINAVFWRAESLREKRAMAVACESAI
jgi:hypothetical protein